jgi:hypothetical protein
VIDLCSTQSELRARDADLGGPYLRMDFQQGCARLLKCVIRQDGFKRADQAGKRQVRDSHASRQPAPGRRSLPLRRLRIGTQPIKFDLKRQQVQFGDLLLFEQFLGIFVGLGRQLHQLVQDLCAPLNSQYFKVTLPDGREQRIALALQG